MGRESGGGGGSEMVFEDGYGGGVEGLEGRRGGKGEAAKLHHNPMEEKKRRVVGKQHTCRRSPTRVRPYLLVPIQAECHLRWQRVGLTQLYRPVTLCTAASQTA